jgi:hypothetical protein
MSIPSSSESGSLGKVNCISRVGLGLLLPFAEVGADLGTCLVSFSIVASNSVLMPSVFYTSEASEAASSTFCLLLIMVGISL